MPRTSVTESRTYRRLYRFYTVDRDGNVIYNSSTNQVCGADYKSRTTVNTPDFRKYRAHRGMLREELPMNPFTYHEYSFTKATGKTSLHHSDGSVDYLDGVIPHYGYCDAPSLPDSSITDAVNNRAIVRVRAALKEQHVNLGIALAESKKTGQMVLDAATRIGKTLRLLKSGDFVSAAQTLTGVRAAASHKAINRKIGKSKALANDFLALRFGWQPLLNDIYGSLEELSFFATRKIRSRVQASASKGYLIKTDNTWDGVPAPEYEAGNYTVKYVIYFSHMPGSLHELSALGITNPASVAWEIVPWSFVIDWFLPIGAYLDSLDATLGLQFESGCKTVFCRSGKSRVANGVVKSGTDLNHVDAASSARLVYCNRTRLNGYPTPMPPTFQPRISGIRQATMAALIRQRMKV